MVLKLVYVCDLFQQLENLEVREIPLLPRVKAERTRAIIEDWFRQHRSAINDPSTDQVALLSTLFPERRTDRVYGLQEKRLKGVLGRCLQLDVNRRAILDAAPTGDPHDDIACRIERMQQARQAGMVPSDLTVEDVDAVLDCIAAENNFSGPEIRAKRIGTAYKQAHTHLQPLTNRASATELKFLVRLILKRFHPVVLDENLVLGTFHYLLPKLLKFQSTFSAAVNLLKTPPLSELPPVRSVPSSKEFDRMIAGCLKPQTGVPVGRPNFIKGRSLQSCYNLVKGGKWTIEPKHDGEYCQVHIDLSKGWNCIQIFSKSGKDSTRDRAKLHKSIVSSLRIGQPDCSFKEKCIIEGEMVVFDAVTTSVLEFWRIRRHVTRSGCSLGTEADAKPGSEERLGIIFYDAMLVDDDVVMAQPYEERRRRLKELVRQIPGSVQRGEHSVVDFRRVSMSKGVTLVEKQFARAIANRAEGLILRPCAGPYFTLGERALGSFDGQIIKLKKDYIPGLGDSADFAIVGARFDPKAAKTTELQAFKWNTFVLACLENKEEVCRFGSAPKFKMICSLAPPCVPIDIVRRLSHALQATSPDAEPDFALISDSFDEEPQRLLVSPIVAETIGGGFDKPSSKNFYSLRNARILKIHDDRPLHDVVSFEELQSLAREAVSLPEDELKVESHWLEKLKQTTKTRNTPFFGEDSCPSATPSPGTTMSKENISPGSVAEVVGMKLNGSTVVETSRAAVEKKGNETKTSLHTCQPTPPPTLSSSATSEAAAAINYVVERAQKRKAEAYPEDEVFHDLKRRAITPSSSNYFTNPTHAVSSEPLQELDQLARQSLTNISATPLEAQPTANKKSKNRSTTYRIADSFGSGDESDWTEPEHIPVWPVRRYRTMEEGYRWVSPFITSRPNGPSSS